jgi:hypothetical protein
LAFFLGRKIIDARSFANEFAPIGKKSLGGITCPNARGKELHNRVFFSRLLMRLPKKSQIKL